MKRKLKRAPTVDHAQIARERATAKAFERAKEPLRYKPQTTAEAPLHYKTPQEIVEDQFERSAKRTHLQRDKDGSVRCSRANIDRLMHKNEVIESVLQDKQELVDYLVRQRTTLTEENEKLRSDVEGITKEWLKQGEELRKAESRANRERMIVNKLLGL